MPVQHPDRRQLLASVLGLSLAALGGCQRSEPLVRVAIHSWVGYGGLFLARELAYLNNPSLRLVEMTSATNSLMALASDQVEAASLTLDEWLVAREGHLDLRVIMVFDESAGADVVMVRPGITRLEQLRGLRVAVEEAATGALVLSRALDLAGLRPDDVIKLPLAPVAQIDAYAKGDVDAVVCFEPYATQLVKAGAHRLVDSRRFPGVIVDVLVARASALTASPAAFKQLLAGYFQALGVLQNSTAQSASLIVPNLGIGAPEFVDALKGLHLMNLADNRRLVDGAAAALYPMAQSVAALMQRSGLLKTQPVLDGLLDGRFLPPG
jgi:NitT/TauT family transport system substrate-binding protein